MKKMKIIIIALNIAVAVGIILAYQFAIIQGAPHHSQIMWWFWLIILAIAPFAVSFKLSLKNWLLDKQSKLCEWCIITHACTILFVMIICIAIALENYAIIPHYMVFAYISITASIITTLFFKPPANDKKEPLP